MAFLVLEQPGELDDDELDRELTLVASLRGRLRIDRFEELLGEAQLRGLVLRTEEDAFLEVGRIGFRRLSRSTEEEQASR
jgi:hypothetical protein